MNSYISFGGSLSEGVKPLKDQKRGETILLREGTHESMKPNVQVFYDPPWLPDTPRILVKELVNGSETRILLDTGASRSAILAKKILRLALPISSHLVFQVAVYMGRLK